MNVEGADVERRLGRSLMPRLHAGFSLGTVAGAGIGAAAAAPASRSRRRSSSSRSSPLRHGRRHPAFLLERADAGGEAPRRSGVLTAWREPRTLLVGLLVLGVRVHRGLGQRLDGRRDGRRLRHERGGRRDRLRGVRRAMTVARLIGARRWNASAGSPCCGRRPCSAWRAFCSCCWAARRPSRWPGRCSGASGPSLGFPVGMSAAADDPARAAVRVSVVSSIGYTAFLAGPPLIGLLAEHVGILQRAVRRGRGADPGPRGLRRHPPASRRDPTRLTAYRNAELAYRNAERAFPTRVLRSCTRVLRSCTRVLRSCTRVLRSCTRILRSRT